MQIPLLTHNQGADVDGLAAQLTSQGVTVLKTFKSEVFSGLSIKTETENLDTLEDHYSIAKAWTNNLIHLPAAINPSSVLDSDVGAKNYSVHAWTGVDKLHEAGIFGKGVTVAIIDTGIDHRHDAVSYYHQPSDSTPDH